MAFLSIYTKGCESVADVIMLFVKACRSDTAATVGELEKLLTEF